MKKFKKAVQDRFQTKKEEKKLYHFVTRVVEAIPIGVQDEFKRNVDADLLQSLFGEFSHRFQKLDLLTELLREDLFYLDLNERLVQFFSSSVVDLKIGPVPQEMKIQELQTLFSGTCEVSEKKCYIKTTLFGAFHGALNWKPLKDEYSLSPSLQVAFNQPIARIWNSTEPVAVRLANLKSFLNDTTNFPNDTRAFCDDFGWPLCQQLTLTPKDSTYQATLVVASQTLFFDEQSYINPTRKDYCLCFQSESTRIEITCIPRDIKSYISSPQDYEGDFGWSICVYHHDGNIWQSDFRCRFIKVEKTSHSSRSV